MKKAVFITFEGGEGSGKSTQIELLKKYCQDNALSVIDFREPGSTSISEQIREILLHHDGEIAAETELMLYCSARAQLVSEKLRPALDSYDVVICDRYIDSTIVYQGHALGLGIEKVKPIVEYACFGIVPDITFFLDIEAEVGLARIPGQKDRIEQRSIEFHNNLRTGYKVLAETTPRITSIYNDSIEKTHLAVLSTINPLLKAGVVDGI